MKGEDGVRCASLEERRTDRAEVLISPVSLEYPNVEGEITSGS